MLAGLRLVAVATTAAFVVAGAPVAAAGEEGPTGPVAEPVPVKADADRYESSPTSNGAVLGWTQPSFERAGQVDFLVQRGRRPPVRVNQNGVNGLGGAVVGRRVFYLQRRAGHRTQIYRYDLQTKRRAPLPAAVNGPRLRGKPIAITGPMSASGSRILYGAEIVLKADRYPYDAVLLHDRATGTVRRLDAYETDDTVVGTGQLNGRYATWTVYDLDYADDGAEPNVLHLVDVTTGRTVTTIDDDTSPSTAGVSRDGTLYYWVDRDLVRHPVGGAPTVVSTVPSSADGQPVRGHPETPFVRDRADGSRAVFFGLAGDIYRFVDPAPAPSPAD